MKINANTVIEGEKVLLVPYKKEHVEQYNKWMQDPELRSECDSATVQLIEIFQKKLPANYLHWKKNTKIKFRGTRIQRVCWTFYERFIQAIAELTFILLDKDVSAIPGTKGNFD